ncbi:MAG: radical SAM protein [Actinomycetota bacterium]|nr:radical SAM protein [Actinomycetota bacterium]
MPGYLTKRVVQVHPLDLCNLRCAHCYSSSAPGLRASLPAARLLALLERLRDEGYEAVSISGGEPFLYRELEALVRGAKGAGYSVNLITNGTVLSNRRQQALLTLLDLVAVSVDGAPDNHDRVRGPGAFAAAERGVDVIAASGVPFGITFCVTTSSLEDVPWVRDFAEEKGARLLSLRPLAPVGRATTMASPEALTAADQARLFLLAQLLDDDAGPRVRVDLTPAPQVLHGAREAFPVLDARPETLRLSDWVNPLVIDERGRVLPFAYGVAADYALGDLDAFDLGRLDSVRDLVTAALVELERSGSRFVDWFELVTATSHAAALA